MSWIVVPLVSDKFEPFDSGAGFFIGQTLMAIAAFYFAFARGFKSLLVFVAGTYIGLNLYPYLFGGSEHRAWAALGLYTSVLLCISPFIAGLLGKAAAFGVVKYSHCLKSGAGKGGAS